MDAFWKWLMRANAKGIFLCAFAALILVAAWWAWKELAPVAPDAPVYSLPPQRTAPATLGLLTFLDAFQSTRSVEVPSNLFIAPQGPRPPTSADGGNTPPPPPPPLANIGNPPLAQPPPPPPPKKDTLSLTYRGLFQRTDGTVLALIEDSKSRGRSFYAASNACFAAKVGEIRTDGITLILNDGTALPVKMGQSILFEEGKYVP